MPTLQERIDTATTQIEADKITLHDIVHGLATETVTTDGGEVKTLAKAVADLEAAYLNTNILVGSEAAQAAAEAAQAGAEAAEAGAAAEVAAHADQTSTHGVTGSLVGTGDANTFTGGNQTVRYDTAGGLNINVFNNSSDAAAYAQVLCSSNAGAVRLQKDSAAAGGTGYVVNSTAGHMSVYNAYASGVLNLGAGGTSNHVTISAAGAVTVSGQAVLVSNATDPYYRAYDSDNAVDARMYASGTSGLGIFGTWTNHNLDFSVNGGSRWRLDTNYNLKPLVDNAYTLGTASYRCSDIYAASGSVNTSDLNEKEQIAPLTVGLGFVNALAPVSFVWKDKLEATTQRTEKRHKTTPVTVTEEYVEIVNGEAVIKARSVTKDEPVFNEYPVVASDGTPVMEEVTPAVKDADGNVIAPAVLQQKVHREPVYEDVLVDEVVPAQSFQREHWGLIAQDVKAALDAAGIDSGLYIDPSVNGEDGPLGLRYSELVPVLIKAVQELSSRLDAGGL